MRRRICDAPLARCLNPRGALSKTRSGHSHRRRPLRSLHWLHVATIAVSTAIEASGPLSSAGVGSTVLMTTGLVSIRLWNAISMPSCHPILCCGDYTELAIGLHHEPTTFASIVSPLIETFNFDQM